MTQQAQPIVATRSEISRHLGISRERVRQLIAERVFEPLADGKLDLDRARHAYIDHLRRPARSAAGDRLREARAREVDLRVAERAHELIPTDAAMGVLEQTLGRILTLLGSMPSRIGGPDLVLRTKIDDEIFSIRTEVAVWLEAQGRALRETGRAAIGLR